jgi:hypothetical protein
MSILDLSESSREHCSPFPPFSSRGRRAREEAPVASSAHVSVAGSDSVESVRLLLDLDASDTALEPRGHVDCPYGRLVIGSPEAIAA